MAAIKARILTPARKHWPNEEFDHERPATAKETPLVRLPIEVGLQAIHPAPKVDRRSLPKPKQVRRYVIQKKDRPDLFPPHAAR